MSCLKILCFTVFFLSMSVTFAQNDDACPTIVQEALTVVEDLCSDAARNQACYGNLTLEAEPQPGVDRLDFNNPGDIADVVDIHSLHLMGMDTSVPEWGVALMRLQANLPDTLPGQNVTFLLFGDIDIETADAEPGEEIEYTPMQSFYFRSGLGDAPCIEAPDSGILVHTPQGFGEIQITVNEVNITLASTAFLQSKAQDALYVYLVEGHARVEAFGEEQVVFEGARVAVPIDEELRASGPPIEPEPYTDEGASALPVAVLEHVAAIAELPVSDAPGDEGEVTFAWPFWNVIQGHTCNPDSGSTTVIFRTGSGCWHSAGEAREGASQEQNTVSIDNAQIVSINAQLGVSPQSDISGCQPDDSFPDGAWHFEWRSEPVTLSPGEHTFFYEQISPRGTLTLDCFYTAQ